MRQTLALAVKELLDSLWELFVDAYNVVFAVDPLHALFALVPKKGFHNVQVVVLGYWAPLPFCVLFSRKIGDAAWKLPQCREKCYPRAEIAKEMFYFPQLCLFGDRWRRVR